MSVSKEGMLEFLNALCEESSINFLSARNQYKVLAFRRLVDDVERWKKMVEQLGDGWEMYLPNQVIEILGRIEDYTYGGKEEK